MIAVYVILGLLAAAVIYLLIAPLRLEIDTSKGVFRVRFHVLAGARLRTGDDSLFLEWNLLGFHKNLDLSSTLAMQKKYQKPAKSLRGTKKSPQIPLRRLLAAIRSFRVKKFTCYVDTGDMALNGQLFPVLMGAGWFINRDVRINFNGDSQLVLEIENNALRLMHAYLFPNSKR